MLKPLAVFAALAALHAPAFAQSVGIPRTADGRPDFQGTWESRWRTPMERPVEADGPIIAADKADAMVEAMYARMRAAGNQSPDEDFDWGPLMPAPGGGYRTSLIVEPADGKRPLNQAAQDWAKVLKDHSDRSEGPEARGVAERCLRIPATAALAVTPDQSYRKFIQTPDHVVIWTEQLGETRIIEMTGRTRPDALVSWLGDSAGRWEGDVLVVETRLVRPEPARPAAAADAPERKLVERFQFNSPDELGYSYTIEDPVMFTAPMRVEFHMIRTNAGMFESACHEGNHGLEGILRGAREVEKRAASTATGAKP